MGLSRRYKRARAHDLNVYQWHIGMVPKSIKVHGRVMDNPARTNAIFVVHGMGIQKWAETAALLRTGFDDVLEEAFSDSDEEDLVGGQPPPAPFIQEGFWANYADLEESFPEEVKRLKPGRREPEKSKSTVLPFFLSLWERRSYSPGRTFWWFLLQQLKLLKPSVMWQIHPLAWLLYFPLQFASASVLIFMLVFKRKLLAEVLGDVRLYVAPKGAVERAMVQRIDKRVGERFLRMMGLDWNFKPLSRGQHVTFDGQPIVFDRIIWLAHSLGSVISYNVLSDLFQRAKEISGSDKASRKQKQGVERFRRTLRRFVTIGSPLDKIAFLMGPDALKPWPDVDRTTLVETTGSGSMRMRDLWVNFYQIFDPVSGALQHPLICGKKPPLNFSIGFWRIPGLAHMSYWRDRYTLTYVLGRVYPRHLLFAPPYVVQSPIALILQAICGYLIWFLIILAFVFLLGVMLRSAVSWLWQLII